MCLSLLIVAVQHTYLDIIIKTMKNINRRGFIKASMVGAAAVAVGENALAGEKLFDVVRQMKVFYTHNHTTISLI